MTDLPVTMRGVWLIGHGDMDKLDIRQDIPVPVPGPRDVLVRVAAAGVNNTDINTRMAWYSKNEGASWSGQPLKFPRIQGADVCGHIIVVGGEISSDRIGERVLIEPCIREADGKILDQPWYFGSECDGGFAEYTVVAQLFTLEEICDAQTLFLKKQHVGKLCSGYNSQTIFLISPTYMTKIQLAKIADTGKLRLQF